MAATRWPTGNCGKREALICDRSMRGPLDGLDPCRSQPTASACPAHLAQRCEGRLKPCHDPRCHARPLRRARFDAPSPRESSGGRLWWTDVGSSLSVGLLPEGSAATGRSPPAWFCGCLFVAWLVCFNVQDFCSAGAMLTCRCSGVADFAAIQVGEPGDRPPKQRNAQQLCPG